MSKGSKIQRLRPSARKVLLLTFEAMDRGLTLQAALSEVLQDLHLGEDVRRQATDLVYSTVRCEERCTFVLQTLYRKWDRFPVPLARLLVGAVTALLFQDRAPDHAIVNETVADVRFLYGAALAGAANAGLRSLLRLGADPLTPGFYERAGEDPYLGFVRFVSVPKALGLLIREQMGEERARCVLHKSFVRPMISFRLNRQRPDWTALRDELLAHGACPLPGKAGEQGLVLAGGVRDLPATVRVPDLVAEGRMSRQSAGSQLALAFCAEAGAFAGEQPIWDVCAGFGGKTMTLLEQGLDVRLCSDTSSTRLLRVPGECRRLQLPEPSVLLADATCPPLDHWPGSILADVPCSGLGVLARRPDIKRRLPDLAGLVPLQERILARQLALVPRGNPVVYMTCTVLPVENEQLVRKVAQQCGAEIVDMWQTPDDQPFEDMFAAILRRR